MTGQPVHKIRLHGPWQGCAETKAGGAGERANQTEPNSFSFTWPGQWDDLLKPALSGSVKIERRFNRPTGLESDQSILLVIKEFDFDGEATLNDDPLGQLHRGEAVKFNIAHLLGSHNRLSIEFTPCHSQSPSKPRPQSNLAATVYLEIATPS